MLGNPLLGRFVSPDNFVQGEFGTQAFNRYGYAMNNPMVYVDPSGEIVWFVPIIIGALAGAYFGGSAAGACWAFGLAALNGSALVGGSTVISGISLGKWGTIAAWGVLGSKAIGTS